MDIDSVRIEKEKICLPSIRVLHLLLMNQLMKRTMMRHSTDFQMLLCKSPF